MDAFSADPKKIKEVFTTAPWLVIIASASYLDLYLHFEPKLSFSSILGAVTFLLATGIIVILLRALCYAVHLTMATIDIPLNHRIMGFINGKTDFERDYKMKMSERELGEYALRTNNVVAKQLIDENKRKETLREQSATLQAYCSLSIFFNLLLGGTLYQFLISSEHFAVFLPILLVILSLSYLYCNYKSMVPPHHYDYLDVTSEFKDQVRNSSVVRERTYGKNAA